MVELLSPAGNMEKMKTALLYGADAVYLAGKQFGMRSAADNFTVEELYEAVKYTHERGKKLYLTVNTLPRWNEYGMLHDYLEAIKDAGIDAYIVADPGVIMAIREVMPEAEIHMSTQAGVVSHQSCMFWYNMGVKRAVLARELSFDDIINIRSKIPADMELECFIHGSMCVSFSGRCLLSENLIGRDANRGMCAQPCRWDYKMYEISELKRPEMRFPVYEEQNGTFIMGSKDMCMIEHVPKLVESGITSFKIEGRMKSAYYAAVTTNAYRIAIDSYLRDGENYKYDPALLRELESVSHREYCTGYFFDNPLEKANLATTNGYIREKSYLAIAESYDKETKRATFIQRNKAFNGETAEIISPGKTGVKMLLADMRDEYGNEIESCPHPFMKFSVITDIEVKPGDILRSGEEK